MRDEALFLSEEDILAYHSDQIEQFGGSHGIADKSLFLSAISAPQNLYCYSDDVDLFDISASYAYHLAKNHPFVDGNKRVALHSALSFINLNGHVVEVASENLFHQVYGIADGSISEKEFSRFLCKFSMRRGGLSMFFHRSYQWMADALRA